MVRRRKGYCLWWLIGMLVIGACLLFNVNAQAKYPDKPISLVVAYPPGGATDFQARIVTMLAGEQKYLGEPIVIVNKPGAGGQVGWNWVIQKGSRDGYTMAAYNVPSFIAQSIIYNTKYNINNLIPCANWGADPAVLIVPKDSPFNSLQDLIAYAKKHPGMVTVTGAGMYTGHQIAFLQLEKAAHIKMTYIPEAGGVPALQAVIADQVKAGFNNLSDAYRNKDRLKILAVADTQRNKFLPKVPTFEELGIAVDDTSVNLRGIVFPKGTPEAIIDKCAAIIPKMFDNPKVLKKMQASGSPVQIMTKAQVAAMFKKREKTLESLLAKFKKK